MRCQIFAQLLLPRMLNTRGVSSFNALNTNNTRILARKTGILLYFINGPPVFSILGAGVLPQQGLGAELRRPVFAIQKGTRVLVSLWDSLMFGRVLKSTTIF